MSFKNDYSEAIVLVNPALQHHFRTHLKQKGGAS